MRIRNTCLDLYKPMWEAGTGKEIQIREHKYTSSCMMLLMMILLNHDVDFICSEETGFKSLLGFLLNLLFMVSGALTLRPRWQVGKKAGHNDWAMERAGPQH